MRMQLFIVSLLFLSSSCLSADEMPRSTHHLPLEDHTRLTIHGSVKSAAGVDDDALVFDGNSMASISETVFGKGLGDRFSMAVWLCPFTLEADQQMVIGKNSYAQDQREWGVMIDRDRRLRAYVWQNGWKTIQAQEPLPTDAWSLVGLALEDDRAQLWVNGKLAAETTLENSVAATPAAVSLGGINDNGTPRQFLYGAIDEVRYFDRPLSPQQWEQLYQPKPLSPELKQLSKAGKIAAGRKWAHLLPVKNPVPIWDDSQTLLKAEELPVLKDVSFHVIKPYEVEEDGYRFLHGVALVWHKDKLYASFGHNKGAENTVSEEARYRVSDDGGKTWSDVLMMDPGTKDLAVSHGVFHSTGDQLWAFHGAYQGFRKGLHTRAYLLNESTNQWEFQGTILTGDFWPLNPPVKMEDGNWIMPGLRVGEGNPTAVAISRGDSMTDWELVRIPNHPSVGNMWGESSIMVDGAHVTNICRYGAKAKALVATSDDYGRTWTQLRESNLPMVTSKPSAGRLSTGQNYLIATTTANSGGRRYPLTIALSRPGEKLFSKVYVIRHAEFPEGPGESHPRAALSYPYTIEHDGKLYVGYSNNGGAGGGRAGNDNSAELAIIPLEQLLTP
ncbi:exo-alpha-sialidase [Bremerella sp. JC770]|uniref:exo-alpha-sialidase n=1 Tax=Bremerella sp. JC770 TaxID=3232137 RepID=UPI0034589714